MGPAARIGCSGYVYDDWRGRFYPADLPRSHWFDHYAARFDTVELNGTFYGLPEPDTVRRWRDRAPDGFTYAVKLSQYGSHRKHLKDPEGWLGTFVDRVAPLGAHLGPVLVQLPPRWRPDPDRLDRFLAATPAAWRWAVEVRDARWLVDPVYDVLRAHDAALVLHDLLPDHPRVVTADWIYLRRHGPHAAPADGDGEPYAGSYSPQALSGLARRLRRHLDAGRDAFVYFNNDIGASAPADAAALRRYLNPNRPRRPSPGR